MRLVVISTFSPSQNVLSTFGTQCVKGFLKMSDFDEVVVLCDYIGGCEEHVFHDRLIVDRCWKQNSFINPLIVSRKVREYRPDVIWINVQYTLFGPSIISSFLGLLIIPALKWMGYPVAIVLHNYLKGVDFDRLGTNRGVLFKKIFNFADPIIMKIILASDKIFVMSKDYLDDLNRRYPLANVEYAEQDLWDVPDYVEVNRGTSDVLIFGVFGTYKRLELLLELFPKIQSVIANARLIIAGQSHPEESAYIDKVKSFYPKLFESGLVTYKGYVEDADLADLFYKANIVVLTNSLVAGSSSTLRFASCFGRGVIVPSVDEYSKLMDEEWGILKYSNGNKDELFQRILDALISKDLQLELSKKNYNLAMLKRNDFFVQHQKGFQSILERDENKILPKRIV